MIDAAADDGTYPVTSPATHSVLTDALELERIGGDWQVPHVAAVLGCHRATLWRPKCQWLMARAMAGPQRGLSFHPSDVRLFQSMQSRRTTSRAGTSTNPNSGNPRHRRR